MKRRAFIRFSVAAIMSVPFANLSQAEEKVHIVKMWTDGGLKYFIPDFLKVEIGDTVRFVNMSGGHNTESIKGMIPDGVASWNSKIKETFDLKITQDGVYGYKCTPHYVNGMVGIIIAGNPEVNLDEARAEAAKAPKRSKEMFERLFAKVKP